MTKFGDGTLWKTQKMAQQKLHFQTTKARQTHFLGYVDAPER